MVEILGIAGINDLDARLCAPGDPPGEGTLLCGHRRRAWAMWLVGSLLVGTLAVHRGDVVFIALQVSTLTSAAIILVLAQKYRGMVCETHTASPAHELTGKG